MARPSAAVVKDARTRFWQMPAAAGGAIVLIHLLPKEPGEPEFRLLLTVVYFSAIAVLLYSMTTPRSRYMRVVFEWRFEETGEHLEHAWRLYLKSLDRAVNIACSIALTFAVATAFSILPFWPQAADLQPLATMAWWLWWGSLLGLVLLPVAGGNLFAEAFQRYRLLDETLETSSFKPKALASLDAAATSELDAQEPLTLLGPYRFQAGGFAWSWEDFYKNGAVFGMTGSGKTLCLLNAILDGLIGSACGRGLQCSGLILDPKGDFRDKIRFLANRWGRQGDLLVLDPGNLAGSIRWNPFDSSDDELELASRFAAVAEVIGVKAGGDDAFWITSAQKFVRHAIALTRSSNPPGEPPSFADINELAVSMARIVERFDSMADDDGRADQALSYFSNEWAELAPETRNSIVAHITNMIDPFLMHPYSELFAGRSSMRVSEMIESGKVLYVHMPVADKELMSRVIGTFVKLEYFREVLRRPNKPRASFFFCDEFQQFFTTMQGKGDADFFERSRQSRHANVIATQNMPALLKAANDRESVVKNLLGNCAVKLFLRNTDDATNRYASELFGTTLVRSVGTSLGGGQGRWSFGGSSSQSSNAQFEPRVRPEEFGRLAVPSRDDGIDFAETIVHLASRGDVAQHRQRWLVYPLQ